MFKRLFLSAVCVLILAALSGCTSSKPKKMLSEDIEVLTMFAPEINVLKDPRYRTNSREKYEAAKKLAEGVDFSLTRSVETLEQLFLPQDALTTHSVEYGDEIAFYYNYQNNYVRFRFWRTKNAVTESEVRIK